MFPAPKLRSVTSQRGKSDLLNTSAKTALHTSSSVVCLPGIGAQSIQVTFIEHLLYARHCVLGTIEITAMVKAHHLMDRHLLSIVQFFFSLNLPSFSYLFLLPSKKCLIVKF